MLGVLHVATAVGVRPRAPGRVSRGQEKRQNALGNRPRGGRTAQYTMPSAICMQQRGTVFNATTPKTNPFARIQPPKTPQKQGGLDAAQLNRAHRSAPTTCLGRATLHSQILSGEPRKRTDHTCNRPAHDIHQHNQQPPPHWVRRSTTLDKGERTKAKNQPTKG